MANKSGVVKRSSGVPSLVSFPPWLLVLIAVTSVQIGAAFAKQLFDAIGFEGVVFVRTFIGGIVFLLMFRPQVRGHSWHVWRYVAIYSATIAANMLLFYAAIERIPLGIAVAIAFAGPLMISVLGSRRAIDFVWVVMAAVGILLLSPITDATLDPVGILFAGICSAAWAIYIIVTKRAANVLPGNTMLALAMCGAAVIAAPFGAVNALGVLSDVSLIVIGLVVALLSTVIPFWLEFLAIQRLAPRTAALLMSLEPAVAALMGWIILREHLSPETVVGIGLVTIAAAMTTRSDRHAAAHAPVADAVPEIPTVPLE